MTVKNFFKSLGKAALYFGIYFGWQVIIMNWLSLIASFYYSFKAGIEAGLESESGVLIDQIALMTEIETKVYDLLIKYALHVTLVAGALAVITFVIIFRMRGKRLCTEIAINKQPMLRLVMCVLLGISLNLCVSVLLGYIPFPESWVNSYNETTEIFVESGIVITLLTTLICAPIVEEITFRGLIYSRLLKGMPMLAAMIVSSWIFGVVHGTMIQFLYAALLGMLICWVRVKYESLTACIALHFGFNLVSAFSDILATLPEQAYIVLLVCSLVSTTALIIYVTKTGTGKVTFAMPETVTENTDSDSESKGE